MQEKAGGKHDMAYLWMNDDSGHQEFETYDTEMIMPRVNDDSGQQQFEAIGSVTCPHHMTVQSLKASAEGNCTICSRVSSRGR